MYAWLGRDFFKIFFLSNWQIADQLQMEKTVGISCPLVTSSWKSFAFKNYFLGQMKTVENLWEAEVLITELLSQYAWMLTVLADRLLGLLSFPCLSYLGGSLLLGDLNCFYIC